MRAMKIGPHLPKTVRYVPALRGSNILKNHANDREGNSDSPGNPGFAFHSIHKYQLVTKGDGVRDQVELLPVNPYPVALRIT